MSPIELAHCRTAGREGVDTDAVVHALLEQANRLPLRQACTQGGGVDHSDLRLSLLACQTRHAAIELRLSAFFNELVGDCNCHDDPVATPVYALLGVRIRRADGKAVIRLLSETDEGLA